MTLSSVNLTVPIKLPEKLHNSIDTNSCDRQNYNQKEFLKFDNEPSNLNDDFFNINVPKKQSILRKIINLFT
jgi:hypothetical protein